MIMKAKISTPATTVLTTSDVMNDDCRGEKQRFESCKYH